MVSPDRKPLGFAMAAAVRPRWLWPSLRALVALLLLSGLGYTTRPWLGEGYASLIFVLGITIIGAVDGQIVAVVSAVLGALLFDFFISEPLFALSLAHGRDWVLPVALMLSALVAGGLSGRLADQTRKTLRSNRQLASLLAASRDLQRASSARDVQAAIAPGRGEGVGPTGLYSLDARIGPVPIGNSPPDAPWLNLAAQACAQPDASGGITGEVIADGGLSACRLDAGNGLLGALVVADRSDQSADPAYIAALGRMVALALERVRLAESLAEARAHARAEELKSDLLASVSHDLRSPLTVIATSAASLLSFGERFDGETSRQLLAGIVEETDRLNHLTSNLLQMTRLQSQDIGLRANLLSAPDMARKVVGHARRQAEDRRIVFITQSADMFVSVDATLFDLALTNVVQNALRYSAATTEVTVSCAIEGVDCVIAVTDAGIGIPPDQQDRVFERFYRVLREDGGARGTGLGLAIAKGFVEASGGIIAATSPARDGRGTTIAIRLPLAEPAPVKRVS